MDEGRKRVILIAESPFLTATLHARMFRSTNDCSGLECGVLHRESIELRRLFDFAAPSCIGTESRELVRARLL